LAPTDDILDAAAAAWTAHRIASKLGASLPDPPQEFGRQKSQSGTENRAHGRCLGRITTL
jgi:hypothetical protein